MAAASLSLSRGTRPALAVYMRARPPTGIPNTRGGVIMRVGIMIEGQEGLTWERWRRLVQAVEDMGYESLCRSDHLTGLWGEAKRPSLETWTSLTMLAMRTRRIRFGPMVSPITFYHPALLAKMAVALDTLSNGRMDLGIGGGWNEHEHAMFGFALPPIKERLDPLEAAARHRARPVRRAPAHRGGPRDLPPDARGRGRLARRELPGGLPRRRGGEPEGVGSGGRAARAAPDARHGGPRRDRALRAERAAPGEVAPGRMI